MSRKHQKSSASREMTNNRPNDSSRIASKKSQEQKEKKNLKSTNAADHKAKPFHTMQSIVKMNEELHLLELHRISRS